MQRLNKLLSLAGVASRRLADQLIAQGRVELNGHVVTELGTKADPSRDHIKVDGKLLHAPKKLVYIALNKPREVVTIFELDTSGEPFAKAVYNYVWTPQTDPDGIVHKTIDYPGVPVDHRTIIKRENILSNVKLPARLHFGTMGLAPSEEDFVSSIPPSYTGGNIDDWRVGKGAKMYYPVAVPGAFFSVGDPHISQGDGELSGTAIEAGRII